jgi:hypothetical protein
MPGTLRLVELPLSLQQEQAWLNESIFGASNRYNSAETYELDGSVQLDRLRRALARLLVGHDSLTASFHVDADGNLVQLFTDDLRPDMSVVRVAPANVHGALVNALAQPFNLTKPPLWRVAVIESDRTYFALVIHHMIADGWSIDLILNDLRNCYDRDEDPVRVQASGYKDYVEWQRSKPNMERVEAATSRWVSRLREPIAASPPTASEHDHRLPAGRYTHTLARSTAELRAGRHGSRWSPLCEWLTAVARVQRKTANCERIILGVPGANRERQSDLAVVGLYAQTFPLPLHLPFGESFEMSCSRVAQALAEVLDDAIVPLHYIVSAARMRRSVGGNPLYQTVVSPRHWRGPRDLVTGVRAEPLDIRDPEAPAKFDLLVTVPVEPGDRWISIEYSSARYTDHYIHELAEGIEAEL